MQTRITYITFDGKEFTNATEANKHERQLLGPCRFCDNLPSHGYEVATDAVVIRCVACRIELACRVDGGVRETAAAEARDRWVAMMEIK